MCGIGVECVIMDCSASSGSTDAPPAAPTTASPEEAEQSGEACDLSSWVADMGEFDGEVSLMTGKATRP